MSELAPYRSDDRRVEGPRGSGTFTIDDATVDHFSVLDPATGLVTQKPVKASDEEMRQREVLGYQRGLASVDHRLATLDPNDVMPYEEPLSQEQVDRRRAGLEAERAFIVARLAELEPVLEPAPASKRRR